MRKVCRVALQVLFLWSSACFSTRILHTPVDSGNTWKYFETKSYDGDTTWFNHRTVTITNAVYGNNDTIHLSARIVDSSYNYQKLDSVRDTIVFYTYDNRSGFGTNVYPFMKVYDSTFFYLSNSDRNYDEQSRSRVVWDGDTVINILQESYSYISAGMDTKTISDSISFLENCGLLCSRKLTKHLSHEDCIKISLQSFNGIPVLAEPVVGIKNPLRENHHYGSLRPASRGYGRWLLPGKSGKSETVEYSISDVMGRRLMVKRVELSSPRLLDITGIASGSYFVRAKNGRSSAIQKLLKP